MDEDLGEFQKRLLLHLVRSESAHEAPKSAQGRPRLRPWALLRALGRPMGEAWPGWSSRMRDLSDPFTIGNRYMS